MVCLDDFMEHYLSIVAQWGVSYENTYNIAPFHFLLIWFQFASQCVVIE